MKVKCEEINEKTSALNHPDIFSDSPKCKHKAKKILVVRRNQQVVLTCDMDADPLSQINFRWTFNTSNPELIKVGKINTYDILFINKHFKKERVEEKGSVSRLILTPISGRDFGTFVCSAENGVGKGEPCIFKVLPIGQMRRPRNCSFSSVSSTSAKVGNITKCITRLMAQDSGTNKV